MFNQSVLLEPEGDVAANKVNVWFASPVSTVYQRHVVNLPASYESQPVPCSDVNLYQLSFEENQASAVVSQNTILDVFEQNCHVDSSQITSSYDRQSPVYLFNTESTDLIPSSSGRITSVAASITRRKGNDFEKSRAIYDYVLARLTYSDESSGLTPEETIDSQTGDSKSYAILFCSLARSSGIPSRPVAGILVNSDKTVQSHWWAEFFIQDFGWFPVDPALADGLDSRIVRENPVEYYWGNIDNHHIAFSRGEKKIPRLFPDGIVYSGIDYAYLTQDVETDRGIINLRSKWSDVKISAIY
jgi:transglutaminase-like putative cysteine protease